MNSEERFNCLLQRVEQLENMILDQGTLGLSQGRQFIYIQKTKTSLWSFIATDEPIGAISITGYIKDIYRKEDDVPKLHIVVRTRETEYVLCSGFETHFSRDVMAAIAQLKPEQLKRPLKILPTVKEPKPGDRKSQHQPVYANVLLDDKTLRTYQLKKDCSAQELFQMAIAALKCGKAGKDIQSNISSSQSQEVATRFKRVHVSSTPRNESRDYVRSPQQTQTPSVNARPPGLDDELPPIPPMRAIAPDFDGADTTLKQESVDWRAFCKQHGILPNVLKALAHELGLPMGKLNPSQSATLYKAAWERFVVGEAAS